MEIYKQNSNYNYEYMYPCLPLP